MTSETAVYPATDTTDADTGKHFMGHPRGLGYIIFTEAWERFSFYGMQGLLILYMSGYLLQPENAVNVWGFAGFKSVLESIFGQLSAQALSAQIFGLYVGLVYFLPVFGGLLGDRYLGRTRAVVFGAILMAIGHFLMAFESLFLLALLSLILGSGFLKGNLAAQVGGLYSKDDKRRDSAYSLYAVAINVGAFIAPLVCGSLGELVGWHYGFGAAGVGMLVGMGIYLRGLKYMPAETVRESEEEKPKLQPGDGRILFSLVSVMVISTFFWIAQTQIWNTYPLWIKARVDRELLDWQVPVTWFQSMDTLAVLILAPFVLWFWRRQSERQREPDDLGKIIAGCLVFGGACSILALSEVFSQGTEPALIEIWWPALFHLVAGIGYLYTSPITLSLVSRSAPVAVNAMMVGCYYLAIFAGGIISGWLGRFYEILPSSSFWFMHAALVAGAGLLIWMLRSPLQKRLP